MPSTRPESIKALQDGWRAESESARAYRELARVEKDSHRKQVLERMADAEDRHAARYEAKLREAGGEIPVLSGGLKTRWQRLMARTLGTDITLRRMEAEEDRQAAKYAAERIGVLSVDEESAKILHEISLEEKAHSRAIKQMTPAPGPQATLDRLLKKERWHGRGGGWVGDAIYGVNDGLGAVFGIVSGVAGATVNSQGQQHTILLAGLAATVASALSMGSGAYLAVKAEREVHEAEMAREKRELDEDPEEEKEEMALFYQLQGFDEEQSHKMVERLAEDPDQMLKTMAQSELGLTAERMPNPWVSAGSASISTAIGAFIPVIPFFWMSGWPAIITAAAVSLLAHFLVGAAKSIITTRSWWASGTEMTIVGAIEGAITYGLGRAFGGM